MKREMRRNLLIAPLFLALGAAGVLFFGMGRHDADSGTGDVEVVQDGQVLYHFTAKELQEERHIVVRYGEHENVLATGGGTIRVEHADCPDQICVQMGELRRADRPILCLPHHLEIRYAKGEDTLDVVAK